jgi:cytochrome c oxidase subunit 2
MLHWFGLTENVAEHGVVIDHLLSVLHWFMAILFIGWAAFFFYILRHFRSSRNPQADYYGMRSHFSKHAEISVVLVEAILLIGFAFPLWARHINDRPDDKASTHVRVVGEQYLWNFQYPGPDGKFGRRSLDLVNANNPLGLDRSDPDAKDDVISKGEMHLPVNQSAILDISSKDVIHNFAIPNMRTAQDAIPGQSVPVWFKPVKTGTYEAICGQLCGAGHYAMRGVVVVDTPAEYQSWLKEQGQLSGAVAAVNPPPAAGTPPPQPPTNNPASAAPAPGGMLTPTPGVKP